MPRLTDFLQIAEAAEYLGVCQNTLRNWGKTGKIKEYRHPANNYRLFLRTDLDAFLSQVRSDLPPSQYAPTDDGPTKKPR